MKPLPLLIALLAAAVITCVVLQVRLIGSQRALGEEIMRRDAHQVATITPPVPLAPPTPPAPVLSGKTADAQVILDAIRLLERSGEKDQLVYLVRTLRRIDADSYFKELTRMVVSSSNEQTINFLDNNNGQLTDVRYIPVFHALVENLDSEGGNRPYQLMRLASQMVGFDQESFQPTIQAAARTWLDSNRNGDSIDPLTTRVLLSSGNPQAHVAVLRSLRTQSYGEQRERTWSQLVDLYSEAHPFPALAFDERQNNEKTQAERAKIIQPVEQWITESRRRLTYDWARKVMIMTASAPAKPTEKATEAAPVEQVAPPVAPPVAPKTVGF